MNYTKIIGRNIRAKRIERNLTIEELSEVLDISSGFLGLIERGVRGTNLSNLCKIKDFFGITLDELITSNYIEKSSKEGTEEESLHNKETILGYLNFMEDKEIKFFIEIIKNYFTNIK